MGLAQRVALLMLASACMVAPAHADGTFTRTSCVARLTTDPNGPKLDPTRLQIGSTVWIDGIGYTIFQGMLLEDVCDLAVRRHEELLAKDRVVVASEKRARTAESNSDLAIKELTLMRTDPMFRYAGLTAWLSVSYTIFFVIFMFYLVCYRPLKRFFRSLKHFRVRRKRSPRSLSTF